MGTWGPGNFDNDGAADYRDEFVDRLAEEIEACLADDDRAALDEEGETLLMPGVAMLAALVEHCGAIPPRPDVIARWKDTYLALYDHQIDSLDPKPSYKRARRHVIAETFDSLESRASTLWREEPPE